MNKRPKKIYVELTTRCNLSCSMCVKHTEGSQIEEMDMSAEVFERLIPSFRNTETLILNGIGESLLHPHLAQFIYTASQQMPNGSRIGLQSNGLLLTNKMADNLLQNGLTTICLSVDTMRSEAKQAGKAHSFSAVERAIAAVNSARKKTDRPFSLGLEIVLSKSSLEELVPLIGWAATKGVDYILTTHLIHYEKVTEQESLFSPYIPEVVSIINTAVDKGRKLGLDFFYELNHFNRFAGTRSDRRFIQLMSDLQKSLSREDARCDFERLHPSHLEVEKHALSVIKEAKQQARKAAIDLFVPPLFAQSEKQCRFIEENSTFVAVNGDIMPCHFLWHTYACHVSSDRIMVNKRSFGNLLENSLEEIWQQKEYIEFHKEAGQYAYAPCWNCGQGPCPTLVNAHDQYANDCFGSQVPCGHCQWNMGGIRCL